MKNFVLTYLCVFSFFLVDAQTTFTNFDGPLPLNGNNCASYERVEFILLYVIPGDKNVAEFRFEKILGQPFVGYSFEKMQQGVLAVIPSSAVKQV